MGGEGATVVTGANVVVVDEPGRVVDVVDGGAVEVVPGSLVDVVAASDVVVVGFWGLPDTVPHAVMNVARTTTAIALRLTFIAFRVVSVGNETERMSLPDDNYFSEARPGFL